MVHAPVDVSSWVRAAVYARWALQPRVVIHTFLPNAPGLIHGALKNFSV